MHKKTAVNKTFWLKNKLKNQRVIFGTWLSLNCESIAEIFCKAGYDWVVVDLEHSSLTEENAEKLIRTIQLCGSVPLVRITNNCPHLIKRVMDSGAHGIIVPQVKTPQEVQQAVHATRYPPAGCRGVGIARAQAYGNGFDKYFQWQKNGPIVLVQIENKEAVDRINEILSVPGVNGFLIGPYDLSCSLGQPGEFQSDKFVRAEKKILKAGIQQKCPAGLHIVEPEPKNIKKAISKGYKIIAYSVDIRMIDESARKGQIAFGEIKKK